VSTIAAALSVDDRKLQREDRVSFGIRNRFEPVIRGDFSRFIRLKTVSFSRPTVLKHGDTEETESDYDEKNDLTHEIC
jgi:hypothetical protein